MLIFSSSIQGDKSSGASKEYKKGVDPTHVIHLQDILSFIDTSNKTSHLKDAEGVEVHLVSDQAFRDHGQSKDSGVLCKSLPSS